MTLTSVATGDDAKFETASYASQNNTVPLPAMVITQPVIAMPLRPDFMLRVLSVVGGAALASRRGSVITHA